MRSLSNKVPERGRFPLFRSAKTPVRGEARTGRRESFTSLQPEAYAKVAVMVTVLPLAAV
jgi:hypothetical protein